MHRSNHFPPSRGRLTRRFYSVASRGLTTCVRREEGVTSLHPGFARWCVGSLKGWSAGAKFAPSVEECVQSRSPNALRAIAHICRTSVWCEASAAQKRNALCLCRARLNTFSFHAAALNMMFPEAIADSSSYVAMIGYSDFRASVACSLVEKIWRGKTAPVPMEAGNVNEQAERDDEDLDYVPKSKDKKAKGGGA